MLDDDERVGSEGYELAPDIAYETARATSTVKTFKKLIEHEKIRILSFYETQMTPEVIKLPDGSYGRSGDHLMLVDRNSVELGISGLEELFSAQGNHSTIVKFKNEQDPTYRAVCGRLNEIIHSAETAAIQELEREKIKDVNFIIPFHMSFPRNRNFVGRAEKLSQIYEYFSDPTPTDVPRVLALIGTGGMGKTQIAIEYAYRHHRDYTAVFWVSAASEDNIRASFTEIMQQIVKEQARITWPQSSPDYHAIGSKLGLSGLIDGKGTISPNAEAVDNIKSALFSWLQLPGNSRWLLIFDNLDDLETFSVEEYLPNQGSGAILITSRRPECSQSTERVDLDGLDSKSAVALLLNLAHLTDISEAPKKEAIRLIEKLGFMPLAISHAGYYIYETKLPLVEYSSYYDKAFMKLQSRKPRFGWDYMNGTAATTWEISFSRVKEEDKEAAMLLLVSSYLNPEEISNDLWEDELANKAEVESKIAFLASYSLVKVIRSGVFSVNPVVHLWARKRSDQSERFKAVNKAVTILGKASNRGNVSRESDEWEAREERRLASHLEYLHQCLKPLSSAFVLEEQGFENQNFFDYVHSIASIFSNQGKYDEAMQWYERALSGKEKILGKHHPSTLDTFNDIARVFVNQGKYDEAMQWYERALAGREKTLGKDHPSTLDTVGGIAGVFSNQGKYDEAMQWYERALAGREKTLGKDHPSTLDTVGGIAGVFSNQGKYDEAMQWYERALSGKEKILGKHHPSTLDTFNDIARVFVNQGKYDEAMQWYKRALSGKEKILGKHHPSTLDTFNDIARVFVNQGKYDEAMQWYERALSGKEKILGKHHPSTLDTFNDIARVFVNQGKYDEAMQWYERALSGKEKILGKHHPSTLDTVGGIAGVFSNQGKYDEAMQWYERALAGREKVLGKDHPSTLDTVGGIAGVFSNQGKYDEAMQWYERALAGREKTLGKDHPSTLDTVGYIARVLFDQGKYDESVLWYGRALTGKEKALGEGNPWATEMEYKLGTDSGYASGVHNYAEADVIQSVLASNDVQAAIESDEDGRTVYSEASTVPQLEKESYISRLAETLYDEVRPDRYDSQTSARVLAILPELLRAFALKLGHNASSQMHRDVMFFVYRYKSDIVEHFKDKCSDEALETPSNPQPIDSNQLSLEERVGLMYRKTEDHTVPREDSIRVDAEHTYSYVDLDESEEARDHEFNMLHVNADTEDADPDKLEEPRGREVNILYINAYRDFINGAPAYGWLVERLRREILLAPAEPNHMLDIREQILKFLPAPRKISKKQSAKPFNVMFVLEWDPLAFVREQGYLEGAGDAIERAITLTGSLADSQALTCAEYLRQTWPSGEQTIQLIKDVLKSASGSTRTCELLDNTKLRARTQGPKFVVETIGTRDSVAEIGEQLAWLGAALSSSPHEFGIVYSVASLRAGNSVNPEAGTEFWDDVVFNINYRVEEKGQAPSSANGQCWHGMFRNPVVVKGYPILQRARNRPNMGLEIPFNMMAGLIQTEHINTFDEKLHLKGFNSMLVAMEKEDDKLMWHLLYNQDGNRISYLESRSALVHVPYIHIPELSAVRHFVGWWSKAKYNAGSTNADYNVQSSGLRNPHEGCALENIYLRPGLRVQGGSSFAVGHKDTPFHIMRGSHLEKIMWIHERYVILWDKKDMRGWLVNGTSALLHLLRKFLVHSSQSEFKSRFTFKLDSIQEAEKTYTTSSAIDVLLNENNLNLEIYRENGIPIRVKDRLKAIYNLLEQIIDYQIDVVDGHRDASQRARRYLEGWDFNDIARVRDPIQPRVTILPSIGKGWVDFTRDIYAITLFGSGFGEIIQSTDGVSCALWATLPKDTYYLAASIRDLKNIMDIDVNEGSTPMRLTGNIDWHHYIGGCEGCRSGEDGQEEHLDLVQVLLPSKFRNTSAGYKSVQLSNDSAVIFGHNKNFKWFWKDIGDPEEGEPDSSSEEPEIWPRDSGIGSSSSSSNKVFARDNYTVGIVCALSKELMAVRALFDKSYGDLKNIPRDPNHYALGCISQCNVVTTCLPSGIYGTNSANLVVSNMMRSFVNIQICFLVGIAGGVPSKKNDIRLGDVVVSQPTGIYPGVIQHDSGKALQGNEFERTGCLLPPPTSLLTAISLLRSKPDLPSQPLQEYIKRIVGIRSEYKHPGIPDLLFGTENIHTNGQETCAKCENPVSRDERESESYPRIHYGLIASGNQVVKDSKARDKLAAEGVLCVEMEAAGITNQIPCLVIRGICDYADSHKNKLWQEYACATAAAYLGLLLSVFNQPDDLVGTLLESVPTTSSRKRTVSSELDLLDRNIKKGKGRNASQW
ncbi:hypothetical protein TWF718_000437 [Orbilia javanica]|uniref:NB-ARC domain-containing protein n=1 Tax=Orbilia javanica TaxID=47235 RepID=A0AAN8MX54_9PEZI